MGCAVDNRLERDLAIRALNMALTFGSPPKDCIHHTDRGSQYCSHDYQKILRQHGFKISMSGKGNCYDTNRQSCWLKRELPRCAASESLPRGQEDQI